MIFVHSAVFHYFNLSVRHTENWNFAVVCYGQRPQAGGNCAVNVVGRLVQGVLIRGPGQLERGPTALRIREGPGQAPLRMAQPNVVRLNYA